MRWYYYLLLGAGLMAFGIYVRKNEVDSAANARSYRGKIKDDSNVEEPTA